MKPIMYRDKTERLNLGWLTRGTGHCITNEGSLFISILPSETHTWTLNLEKMMSGRR
jgi:hypothetical protein